MGSHGGPAGASVAAAGVLDPAVLLDASGPARAAASFLLVALFGAGLLARREALVHRAVDRTADGSPVAVVYGLMAFALVGFVGGYLLTQVGRVGVGGTTLLWAVIALVGAAVLVLAALGYTVVGTWLTQIEGARRPWPGVVVGAVLSALPWLVLPPLFAALAWFVLAAVGLGSSTRTWVHGERTVETEA